MASNTGEAPSASSPKAPAPKQTTPAKKLKRTPPVTKMTCGHGRVEYQVQGQEPDEKYHAMESILGLRDLRIEFEDGNIVVTQKKAGPWCIRTFLKEHITWDNHQVVVEKQTFFAERFLQVDVHIKSIELGSTITFRSNAIDGRENPYGIEQARDYPLAKLPNNVSKLRLLLAEAADYWSINEGAKIEKVPETRCRQIKRILTGTSSVSRATPKPDGDLLRKQEAGVEKELKIKIDESTFTPVLAPAAASMPEAGLVAGDPIASVGLSTPNTYNDIARGATEQLRVWAKQQGLARQSKGLEVQTGLLAIQPRQEEPEIEGKGGGKSRVEEEVAELELQLVRLEETRIEKQRQLRDRFRIEASKVDQECGKQRTELQERLDRLCWGS